MNTSRAQSEWVRKHVEQIVRTGTTDGVTIKGMPTVLMTYRGRKTGKVRKAPVMRVAHDGSYAAVASQGGAPTNPHWYASLVAEPVIELQDGAVTREYKAREVFGDEKAVWWHRAVDAYPYYAEYQRKTDRRDPGLRARTGQRGRHRRVTAPGPESVPRACHLGLSAVWRSRWSVCGRDVLAEVLDGRVERVVVVVVVGVGRG